MRFTIPAVLTAATLLSVAQAASADASTSSTDTTADAFTLKLTRPSHVGDTDISRIHASRHRRLRVTHDGMVLQDQQTHLEVSEVARTRILQVSPDGRTIRQRVQILSLEGRTSREAKWTPQPLKGVTLEITLSPKLALVRTDGKILAESLRQYLELIYTVSDPAIKYTDDVIFGPSGPVRVGDTWTADTEKMISELNQKGELKLSPNDMVSLFSLDARKIVNGIDCLVVHGTLEANRIEQASGNTIPLRDFSGKIHATFHKVVPVDTAKTEIAEDSDGMEMEMSGKATSPQGGEVDVLMSESDEMDTTTLPNGSR